MFLAFLDDFIPVYTDVLTLEMDARLGYFFCEALQLGPRSSFPPAVLCG
jgi:hypothetical protein